MTKVSGRLGVLVALMAASIAIADGPKVAVQKHQGKDRAYDKDAGISLVPPAGWAKAKAPEGIVFNFMQPAADGSANMNVKWTKNDGSTVDKLPEILKGQYAKQLQNWKLLDESNPTIDGKKSYAIAMRHTFAAKDKNVDLAALQYWIYGGNQRIYVVTFTTQDKNFEKERKAIEKAAMSTQTD